MKPKCNQERGGRKHGEGICRWDDDADPIAMANLDSVTICGKRGGKSFATASRPGLDGNCSEELIPCSNSTSPENTICVSIEDLLSGKCPITDIKLVDQL